MGQVQKIHANGAAVYIGDYVATAMSDLELAITTITRAHPTERAAELLYLIGIVKLAAFDVQGITPVPHFSIGAAGRVAAPRIESDLDDCTVMNNFPWNWSYGPVD